MSFPCITFFWSAVVFSTVPINTPSLFHVVVAACPRGFVIFMFVKRHLTSLCCSKIRMRRYSSNKLWHHHSLTLVIEREWINPHESLCVIHKCPHTRPLSFPQVSSASWKPLVAVKCECHATASVIRINHSLTLIIKRERVNISVFGLITFVHTQGRYHSNVIWSRHYFQAIHENRLFKRGVRWSGWGVQ